jgi:PAS domain S-box-containing protein
VIGVALIVLTGWLFDLPLLRSFSAGQIEMKIITAIAFLFAGAALLLLVQRSRISRRLGYGAAIAILALAGPSLIESISGADLFGTSPLVFDVPDAPETMRPGRMAPATAVLFVAAAFAMIVAGRRGRPSKIAVRAVLVVMLAVSLLVLIGSVYDSSSFRAFGAQTPMALPTSIAFLALTAGIATMRIPKEHLLRVMYGTGPASSLARRLIPAAIAVPILFGWLRILGQRRGLYDLEFGAATFVVMMIIAFLILIGSAAIRLDREDRQRQTAEARLRGLVTAQQEIARGGLDFDEILRLVTTHAQKVTMADGAAVATMSGGFVEYRTGSGIGGALMDTPYPVDSCLAGRVLKSGEMHFSDDALRDVRVSQVLRDRAGFVSEVMVPLRDEHRVFAALGVMSTRPGAFSADDFGVLQLIGSFASGALAHAEAFAASERQVAIQSAELSSLQKQFTAFMENTPTVSFIKDARGAFLYANPRLLRLLGRSLVEIEGTTGFDLLPNGAAQDMHAADQAVLKLGAPLETIDTIPLPTGDPGYWLMSRFRISDSEGRHLLGGVGVDITQRRHAEQQLHALNEELEQRVLDRTAQLETANHELEAFSYSVSHDLRAPLRAVDGYARMLQEDYLDKLESEGKRFLETIRAEAARMGTLIDDLLAFSRIGRQPLSLAPISMKMLFSEVFNELRRAVPDRKIDLTLHDLPPAHADRTAIGQVIVNLLSNAIKFTSGRPVATIVVGFEIRERETVYSIRDNGAGFDDRYADKLFAVFQRLHKSEEFEGTGVGLAIVQRVVKRHGGEVWAEGTVGEGASFYFTLPRVLETSLEVEPGDPMSGKEII